ncbi:MAG: hypothetical protein ABI809_11585 [Caldimonas sp.]
MPAYRSNRRRPLLATGAAAVNGRYDTLDPDNFKYTITAREIPA